MKSVLSVSMHKAGSSIADLILVDFFEALGMEIDRVANKVSASPLQEPAFFDQYKAQMKPAGVYYGMARHPGTHDLEFLRDMRIICQMRDPRDCLTSAYFSYAKSHIPPTDPVKRAEHEQRSQYLKQMTIESFVLASAPGYRDRCKKLRRILTDYPDTLSLRYEEMVQDTETWLGRISQYLDQPLTPELHTAFGHKTNFKVTRENPNEHKRQVTPGDHRRKLQPETIDKLNEILGPELDYFGYER